MKIKELMILLCINILFWGCEEKNDPVTPPNNHKATEAPKQMSVVSGDKQVGFPNRVLDSILIKIVPAKWSDVQVYSFGYRYMNNNIGMVTWNQQSADSALYIKVAWKLNSLAVNQQLVFYIYLNRDINGYTVKPTDSVIVTATLREPWKLIYHYSGGWYPEYTDIHFSNDKFGIVVGDCINAGVIKTEDGGDTWDISSSLRDDYYKLTFLNRDTGLVTVTNNYACLTYDGGKTFTQFANWVPPIIGHHSSSDNCMIDLKTIISIGANGTIVKTIDGGKSWKKYTGFNFINSFNFITRTDKNTLYACGVVAKVVKSTDACNSWAVQDVRMNNNLKVLYFLNNDVGFAGGERGGLIGTVNGGSVWEVIPTGLTFDIIGIKFFSQTLGYIASNGGEIAKTTDAGKHWKMINIDNYGVYDLKKVWFKDSTTLIGIQSSSIHKFSLK